MTTRPRLAFASAALAVLAPLALLAPLAPLACHGSTPPAMVGRPTPDVLFSVTDGGELRAARSRGDVVVLAFFATWCPASGATLRAVEELRVRHEGYGLSAIAINEGESATAVAAFVANARLRVAVGFDKGGAVATEMALATIPTLILIDRRGIVRHVHAGYHGAEDRFAIGREVAALVLEPLEVLPP
jgi:peroxiredoxin